MKTAPTIVIMDAESLDTLPIGQRFQDRDGDVHTKVDEDQYRSLRCTLTSEQMAAFLPGLVLFDPVELHPGDEVRATTKYLRGLDRGTVIEATEHFAEVEFDNGVTRRVLLDDIELVRRDMASARKASDAVIDLYVAAFGAMLAEAPEAPEYEGPLLTAAEVAALPDGSVVRATVETEFALRVKEGGVWRVTGQKGGFNYSTYKLAMMGKLRLVYVPPPA